MKILKKVTGDVLLDAIAIEGTFSKREIRFSGSASVGESVADEQDRVILISVDLNELFFASSTEAAFLIGKRKREFHAISRVKTSAISIERNL